VDPSAPDTPKVIAKKAKKVKKNLARQELRALGLSDETIEVFIPIDAG